MPYISIKDSDKFTYDPWGGDCIAFFRDGVLIMNRMGTSDDGAKTWKCKNAEDTEKLLKGKTVMVKWDHKGEELPMTVVDFETIKVMHGATPYYFRKQASSAPSTNKQVISVAEGDEFHYEPWGGTCYLHYPCNAEGRLHMNRKGTAYVGLKTWHTKDAADTKKLLEGETVMVEWDNENEFLPMTAIDNDTFKVMHGHTPYYFTRIHK